jgi:uncharacterized protein
MLIKRTILSLIGCTLLLPLLYSQDAIVVIQNQKDSNIPIVNIKWYSQDFVYKEGVNLYRKESQTNDWTKLNALPIKQKLEIPKIEIAKDSDLFMFQELMKEIKQEQINGMILLQLMAKTFQSPVFSRYIGIQYDDSSAIPSKSYQYKVMRIKNGMEQTLAISEGITIKAFSPLEAPKNFFAKQYRKSAKMGWDAEDTRFYATNIYRASKATGAEIKLNNKPVTISMIQDSSGNFHYPEYKFVDDSVKEGGTYYYRIAGLDFFGNETQYTPPVKVAISDLTPPSAPINVQKTIKKQDVTIFWENTEKKELAGFNVYRSINDSNDYYPANSVLLPPGVTSFIDRVPKSGGYYYFVAAVDTVGNEGYSDKMFAEVADLAAPSIPQHIKAVADTGKVILTWDAVTEPDLMGYQVYRTINSDEESYYVLLNANPVIATTFTDTLPANARNYFYYKVISIDTSYNRSDYSQPVSARMPDVMPPEKPFIKSVTQLNNNLVVEWIPNMEPDLAGYEVFRSVKDIKVNYAKLSEGLIDNEVSRFTDRNVQPDTIYNYYLVAIDSTGNRSASSDYFTARLSLDNTIESSSVINSFTVKKRKNTYKLLWDINTSPDFIGVAIYRKTNADENPEKLTDVLNVKTYNDNYKNKTKPSYQLRLYHTNGKVVKSDWITN